MKSISFFYKFLLFICLGVIPISVSALEIGLSVSDATITESDGGTSNMTFTVSASSSVGSNIPFNYSTSNGTAVSGSDYTTTSGTSTITAGSSSTTISVPITGDLSQESSETFSITITSATPVYDDVGIGTITDNDTRSIAINDVSITEGNSGTTNVTMTVTLTGNTASVALPFTITTGGGTATSGTDYTAQSNVAYSIAAGTSSKTFTIPIVGDIIVESSETFNVTLASSVAGLVGDGTGVVTINDNDKYTLTLSPTTLSTTEGNSGTTNAAYTVTLSESPTANVTVNYATANGTASSGSDYTSTSGTLTFSVGQTSKTINVPILGDTTAEPNETYTLSLSSPSANAQLGTSSATGTITNDDSGTLSISQSGTSISESGGSKTYTVTLSTTPTSNVTVNYATANGTATAGSDYTAKSGTLTFASGTATLSQAFTVSITDDTTQESDETYSVSLSSPANATISTASVTTTITDNDGRTLSISPTTHSTTEGNSGSTNTAYTVTLSGTPLNAVTVNYATANGTATAGSDYTSRSGTLTFAAGTSTLTQTITVPILGDTTPETNENFTLTLSSPTNATITTATATETITNDDSATLSIDSVSTTEGNSGTKNLTFTVTLSAAQSSSVTVNYATSNGTATAGSDYVAKSSSLTFTAGQTSKTLTVTINGDTVQEADETFNVTLSSASGATIGTGTGVGTITNDDAVTLAISPTTLNTTEGNSGSTNASYTVTLSGIPLNAVTVNYSTSNLTATAGSDYTSKSGTLTFAAGTSTLTQAINVPILGDTTVEPNETYRLTLSGATNATISTAVATGTIVNDDTSISINDITILEPPCFDTTANLTVTLAQAVNYNVTVGYSTGGGTATAGASADYNSTSGSIIIPAGSTTGTISVTIHPDSLVESTETFNVTITNSSGITITDNVGVVSITDNQNTEVSYFNDSSVVEGDVGQVNMPFTVTLCKVAASNTTISYRTQDNTAVDGGTALGQNDYDGTQTGSVTIPTGSLSATFNIPVNGDLVNEGTWSEGFVVELFNWPSTVTFTPDIWAWGQIIDDDSRTISINDTTVTEGNSGTTTATLRITMSAVASAPVTVNYSTRNGTATTADSDYVQNLTGSVIFTAGQTTKDITFTVNGDTKVEGNEYFDVNISTPSGVTVSDNTGRVTITDDDNRTLTLGGTNTYTEGNVNRDINLTVTLSSASPVDRTITYSTTNGTATAGQDFIGVTNQAVIIPANTTTVNLPITIIGNLVYETLSETFSVSITSVDGFARSGSPRTITITDDDGRLSVNDRSVTEGDSGTKDMTFTVTLNRAMTTDVNVSYTTSDNTATVADNDYNATSGVLTFTAGQTSKTFIVKINGDTKYELTETFNVTIANTQGVTVFDANGVGTITDNDARTITINSPSYAETETNTSRNFTVTLSASRLQDTNLTFTTSNATATAGSDYVTTSGVLTIPSGTTSKTLPVTILGDYVNEPNESFSMTLSTSEAGITIPSAGVMTITNDDGNLSIISTVSRDETNTSSFSMPFTVTLSQAMSSPVVVAYTTMDGDATSSGANKDFEAASGTLTFAVGETSKTINVTIYGDIVYEGTEYFDLNISNTQGVNVTASTSRGYIVEDDARTISLISSSANEGDIGVIESYVTVNLSLISGSDANVSYVLSGGSAIAGVDFNATSGSVIIPAGSTNASIPIQHYGDLTFEPNETVNVAISTTTLGFTVVSPNGTFTLVNDDGVLSMEDVSVLEGNTSTTTPKDINVLLSRVSTLPITVNYATVAGSATANVDYNTTSGSVIIPAGSLSVSIPLTILGDAEIEGNEAFTVHITNDQNVTINDADGTVTITDDDVDAMEIFDRQREFSRRFGKNIYGNYISTGAPIMCALNDTNTSCDWNRTGSLASSVTRFLNDDPTISNNSSSADLNISMDSGDKILWAGLYWQGHIESNIADDLDNNTSGWNSVVLKTPDGTAHTITADLGDVNQTNYYAFQAASSATYDGFRFFYQGFADVTDEVNATLSANAGRTFSVGNMKATVGADHRINDPALEGGAGFGRVGHFGGWSLVVVFEKGDKTNPDDLRNVSIFDGYKYLVAGSQDPATPQDETIKSIDINVNGFRTPSSLSLGEPIDSQLLYFGGGSEKSMTGDQMDISDKLGNFSVVYDGNNPSDNPFNDTIGVNGVNLNSTRIFNPGIDLDTIQVGEWLDTNQSSATIRLSAIYTDGSDQAFAGVVGFSTQLYQPQLCYDFTYKQNNVYLKSTVAERDLPTLKGFINNAEITAGIYLKNTDSDFAIEGLSLFTDMNGSKIQYIPSTAEATKVNGAILKPLSESSGCVDYATGTATTVACNFDTDQEQDSKNIRLGLGINATGYSKNKAGYLDSGDVVYTQFKLDPFGLSGDVNESLGLKINYFIDLGDGEIPYEYTLGTHVKLCPPSTTYTPTWGQFNIVDADNKDGEKADTNNLYTQVAKRAFSVDVAYYESNGGLFNIPPSTASTEANSTVMVEIIDADAYHDINASCANPAAALTSDPIFVEIHATTTDNTESVVQQAVDYYNFAVKNAAFRIWYFDDGNGALVQNWTASTGANGRILSSINGLYQSGKHTSCASECTPDNSTACFECMKDNYAHPICSRDNFSVRPESFDLRISDLNQTSGIVYSDLSSISGHTPPSPAATQLKLAAGYKYSFDISATNHNDLDGTPGYTRFFTGSSSDFNATMLWNSAKTLSECNNIDGVTLTFDVINGVMADANQSNSNAGEYLLNIIDNSWTAVDWRDTSHHTVAKNFDTANDCLNSSTTSGRSGCIITTQNHSNGTQLYKDHDLRFYPYKFDLSSIAFKRGLTPNNIDITAGARNFLYMADISNTNDMNMSLHATGNIVAKGADNSNVSNFVSGCYAQDVNLSMDYTLPDQNLTYQGRLVATDPLIDYDTNATIISGNSNLFVLGEGNFTKALNGSTAVKMYFNYDRNSTKAFNPARINFSELSTGCSDATTCQINADNDTSKDVEGAVPMGFGITHYYGRAQGVGSRIKPTEDDPTIAKGNIRLNFEVFCGNDGNTTCTSAQKALLPDGLNSVVGDDRDWYKNRDHNSSNDGIADDNNELTQKSGIGNVTVTSTAVTGTNINASGDQRGYQYFGATYTGNKGFPYTTIMTNTPSSWLIYNKNNSNATLNEFTLEFYKPSAWVGQKKTETSTDSDASVNPSRRIMW